MNPLLKEVLRLLREENMPVHKIQGPLRLLGPPTQFAVHFLDAESHIVARNFGFTALNEKEATKLIIEAQVVLDAL
jgi:hypothetical protein